MRTKTIICHVNELPRIIEELENSGTSIRDIILPKISSDRTYIITELKEPGELILWQMDNCIELISYLSELNNKGFVLEDIKALEFIGNNHSESQSYYQVSKALIKGYFLK